MKLLRSVIDSNIIRTKQVSNYMLLRFLQNDDTSFKMGYIRICCCQLWGAKLDGLGGGYICWALSVVSTYATSLYIIRSKEWITSHDLLLTY